MIQAYETKNLLQGPNQWKYRNREQKKGRCDDVCALSCPSAHLALLLGNLLEGLQLCESLTPSL